MHHATLLAGLIVVGVALMLLIAAASSSARDRERERQDELLRQRQDEQHERELAAEWEYEQEMAGRGYKKVGCRICGGEFYIRQDDRGSSGDNKFNCHSAACWQADY